MINAISALRTAGLHSGGLILEVTDMHLRAELSEPAGRKCEEARGEDWVANIEVGAEEIRMINDGCE